MRKSRRQLQRRQPVTNSVHVHDQRIFIINDHPRPPPTIPVDDPPPRFPDDEEPPTYEEIFRTSGRS